MPTPITSPQNDRIKNLVKLQNRRQRDAQQLMLVEGVREAALALANGFLPEEAYICPELVRETAATAVTGQLLHLEKTGLCALFTITPDLFAKVAYRGESGGVLLLIPYWTLPLSSLLLSPNPCLVIIEGGEKPGNLGAILRTADAAGADAVIISETDTSEGTDIFNPNVVRASLGALFTVPVTTVPTDQLIAWLREQHIHIAAATPEGEKLYTAVSLQNPIALVMGSEANGLSQTWLDAANTRLLIPMHGQVDSLNLSVSTALLLYEVVRQRREG
ncbi:MAG: rRNA methyltransferase [Chloroflexota bacterium]|nr:RNA methyltransferase [Ardenticatenaceae bacterium]GIK55174.1 MAG: rRNA methyltransferase [Chloroflexota bacterium]